MPEAFADECNARVSGLVGVGSEGPAAEGTNAQGIEELGADARSGNALRFAHAGQYKRIVRVRGQLRKRSRPLSPEQEVCHAGGPAFGIVRCHAVVNPDQAGRIVIRQRAEQNGIDDAKDGSGSADTQRQCDDCDRREGGTAEHGTQSVANVAKHLLRHDTPPREG